MSLNLKKIKSIVVSRSRTYASGYSGVEREEVRSLRILGATFYSKFTLETHMRKVVPKVARSLCVILRARKLFDCPRVPKSCFNVYVFLNLDYCAPV